MSNRSGPLSVLLLASLCGCASEPGSAPLPSQPVSRTPRTEPWVLSNESRRAFLRHYAPVIFKQADERAPKHAGHDWITNFFFDGDRNLANNKKSWSRDLVRWIAGDPKTASWSLRPTLYTALIEFGSPDEKSLVLLYHVYHTKQRGSIHDWERVELRLDGVQPTPGHGERVAYAVVTEHSTHHPAATETLAVPGPLWLWQAPWSGKTGPRKAELRYVRRTRGPAKAREHTPRRDFFSPGAKQEARVEVEELGPRPVHYVFSLGGRRGFPSLAALTNRTGESLTAGTDQPVPLRAVKFIEYELQDLADVLPTHLDPVSWKGELQISLSSAVLNEDGSQAIPPGPTRFLFRARDEQDEDEKRKGYPRKHWFWGTYDLGGAGWTSEWIKSVGEPLPQHDYFAHTGLPGRAGVWLRDREGWWRAERGGFDGRWVALFAD
ncbi:MAG: hypothetical protein JKY65_05225 [Planctomycetes bacterium]|nr:hypothetical protein [Planctomycetota bacterium]